jgi:hypothetical protein
MGNTWLTGGAQSCTLVGVMQVGGALVSSAPTSPSGGASSDASSVFDDPELAPLPL